jgi:hypothetical protein
LAVAVLTLAIAASRARHRVEVWHVAPDPPG